MASLFDAFNQQRTLKITQSTGKPDAKSLAAVDQLLLILPKQVSAATWRQLPQGEKLKALMRRRKSGSVPAISTRLANKRQTAVHVGMFDATSETIESLTFARKLVAAATGEKPGTLGIWIAGFAAERQSTIAAHFAAAASAAAFVLPAFKHETRKPAFRSARLLGLVEPIDLERIAAEAAGNNLARWLTALPPNKLNARSYAVFLRELAAQEGWQYKQYTIAELRKMGAGAFCAVAQGNADDDASIVRLRYRPGSKSAKPSVALVGKGIIFDTGGNNLKPFNSMLDMHIDMGGSGVAAGTLLTLTKLGYDEPVDCWHAITENRIGPTAYKSQDVITALNGKTIQTIHTDAEGRMALADTLVLATRDEPQIVIDYATLTGAAVTAVTTRISAVFTNREDLHPLLKKAGRESGERVWPFPLGSEFMDDLKSETADIKQCSPTASGDHILAATFLDRFIENDVPWIHIDLSACTRKGGLAHVATEITGFGVRFSADLIVDRDIVEVAANA